MAARRSNDDEGREMRVRLAELEARVRWLESQLRKLAFAVKVKPEPGQVGNRPRCPGCFAEVPRKQRERTCLYCGFSFDVVAPFRPRSRR